MKELDELAVEEQQKFEEKDKAIEKQGEAISEQQGLIRDLQEENYPKASKATDVLASM